MTTLACNGEGNRMNIFILSDDPTEAAQAVIDKHAVKMPLETAQVLCTISHDLGTEAPYKPTHRKHPCVLWAAESLENWTWTLKHGLALCDEYSRRYGKRHASETVLHWLETSEGKPEARSLTPFAQAMPEAYKRTNAVDAYRAYYLGEKASIASWKAPAAPPSWWNL